MTQTAPKTNELRELNYHAQSGPNLTPAQKRRMRKAANRAKAREAK